MSVVGRRAIAFGTTLNRELLPMKVPPNRFGNELGLRGAPNRGPGCYDNAEVVKKMPVSWLFVFFSSTACKFLCEQALRKLYFIFVTFTDCVLVIRDFEFFFFP